MTIFSKDIGSLEGLYLHNMRSLYYAEKQIEKALPKMIDKASDPKLKEAFSHHLAETHGHVRRLEEVFLAIGAEVEEADCPAINGIIEEADEITGDISEKSVCDAALAAAAQAVEHYEITRYGTLIAWSKELGRVDCAGRLRQILVEEKAADEKLTRLAESRLNEPA